MKNIFSLGVQNVNGGVGVVSVVEDVDLSDLTEVGAKIFNGSNKALIPLTILIEITQYTKNTSVLDQQNIIFKVNNVPEAGSNLSAKTVAPNKFTPDEGQSEFYELPQGAVYAAGLGWAPGTWDGDNADFISGEQSSRMLKPNEGMYLFTDFPVPVEEGALPVKARVTVIGMFLEPIFA